MITAKTVLIVGAGASVPYRMPTGERLTEIIISECEAIGHDRGSQLLHVALTNRDVRIRDVGAFGARLANSRLRSVDMLLEKHPDDKGFQLIGRLLIAHTLLTASLPGVDLLARNNKTGSRDWLGYLLNVASSGARTADDFKRLSIVNFNFDPICEDVIAPAIAAQLGIDYGGAATVAQSMVLHVHGKIERRPKDQPLGISELLDAADAINIVHDEIPVERLEQIRKRVHGAEVVAFLGFGFHPDNLAKLDFPVRYGLSNKGRAKTCAPSPIFVCGYGIGKGERENVNRAFEGHWNLEMGAQDQDCLEFLRQFDVLRDNPRDRPRRKKSS